MKSFLKYTLATITGVIFAAFILFFIFAGIIGAMISSADKEPSIEPNSILHIKLNAPIPERTSENFFEDLNFYNLKANTKLGLNDILANIKKAKTDSNIKGIYLDLSIVNAGWGTVEEIRNALIDFKKSKKFIISYSELYTQKAYYLATTADSIFLNPQGELLLVGLRSEVMFFKGALDKLEIEPEIFRHGKFKSAVEPFTSDKMSPENKQQLNCLLSGIWNHTITEISKSRKISTTRINEMADNITIRNPESAFENKLIDGLRYKDQIIDRLVKLSGVASAKKLEIINLSKYNKIENSSSSSDNKIALVYASGEIKSGDGDEESIGSEKLSKAIREARNDSSIKAIVLRVNSPGGSAMASEVIWRELYLAAKTKPLVVSMGDMAASGGYYISAPAHYIVAEPTTITGSIGVFGIFFNAKKLINNKLGITTDVAKTNTYADAGSIFRPVGAEERLALQSEIDRTYNIFVNRVSTGRKLTAAQVDSIGQGRVWSATDALRLGLADTLGGIDIALKIAAKKAKVKQYEIVELPKQDDALTTFINDFMSSVKTKNMMSELGTEYYIYYNVKQLINYQGVQTRLPYELNVY